MCVAPSGIFFIHVFIFNFHSDIREDHQVKMIKIQKHHVVHNLKTIQNN